MSLSVEIQKRLGEFTLDLRFESEAGMLALLGASGCGKSMTLKCIAGIETPDRGRIVLNGRVLFDSEKGVDLPPQKRRVGYLFQQYALFPNMTVEQNLRTAVRKLPKAEQKARVAERIAAFRLEGLEKHRPHQLSWGQQQRAALARILLSELKAKDFAAEMTSVNVQTKDLKSGTSITKEHVDNNTAVRQMLIDRGIVPEDLPPAEDVKKVERRLANEQREALKNNKDKK